MRSSWAHGVCGHGTMVAWQAAGARMCCSLALLPVGPQLVSTYHGDHAYSFDITAAGDCAALYPQPQGLGAAAAAWPLGQDQHQRQQQRLQGAQFLYGSSGSGPEDEGDSGSAAG